MLNQQHQNFLNSITDYVTKYPEVAAFVSEHAAAGINASRKRALERAADMEVALCVAIARRYGGRDALIVSKLEKWKDASSIAWEDTIEMLKHRIK
jgi:hypothetical protein